MYTMFFAIMFVFVSCLLLFVIVCLGVNVSGVVCFSKHKKEPIKIQKTKKNIDIADNCIDTFQKR